ncbi:MAG: hypothetical protein ACOCRX_02315 [Candidatus Woesearchaeota archaeon]
MIKIKGIIKDIEFNEKGKLEKINYNVEENVETVEEVEKIINSDYMNVQSIIIKDPTKINSHFREVLENEKIKLTIASI